MILVKRFILAAVILVLTAPIALAGPNAGGVLVLHDPGLTYTTDATYIGLSGVACGQDGPVSPAVQVCPPYDPIGGANPCDPEAANPTSAMGHDVMHVWYVMAAFPNWSCPRLKSLGFRIKYDPTKVYVDPSKNGAADASAFFVTVSSDEDGSPFPSDRSGVGLSFTGVRTSRLQELWWFAGYSYSGATAPTFAVEVMSGAGNNLFGDDSFPTDTDLIAGFGTLGFDGTVGVNPIPGSSPIGACCAPSGSCTMITEVDCDLPSIWHGDLTFCAPNPCPPPAGTCRNSLLLQAHRWEWIGLRLLPANSNASSVFGSLGSNLRIAKDDEGHVYIPGVYDNLSPLGIENGYQVFLGDSATVLEVTGRLPSLEQDCIPIVPDRWNLIPYLTDSCDVACALEIGEAMGAWADSIVIVQNDGGDVWIPEQSVDTIGMLDPWRGYYLFPRATTDFDICYPSCGQGGGAGAMSAGTGAPVLREAGSVATRVPIKAGADVQAKVPVSPGEPRFYPVQATGRPEIVLVTETSVGILSEGDEIAMLCEGSVVGAARFPGSWPLVVPVWRGSAELGLKGFTPGASMTAELWEHETGRRVALLPLTEDGQPATFRFEPYSRVHLQKTATLATGDPAILWARPNPSRGAVEIACRLPQVGDDTALEIYDPAGRLVRRLMAAPREGVVRATWDGTAESGSRVASGVYFLRLRAGVKGSEQRLLILR